VALVKAAAEAMGGKGGGGRPDMAQAGGADIGAEMPPSPPPKPLMCRWAAYTGAPIFLEEIISRPGHSLIHQSHCATQCHSAINADGFGIAWYGESQSRGCSATSCPPGRTRT
jgi:hypothetical protein